MKKIEKEKDFLNLPTPEHCYLKFNVSHLSLFTWSFVRFYFAVIILNIQCFSDFSFAILIDILQCF